MERGREKDGNCQLWLLPKHGVICPVLKTGREEGRKGGREGGKEISY